MANKGQLTATARDKSWVARPANLARRAARIVSGIWSGLFAYGHLTTSERRVLAIEKRLRSPVVRFVGRGFLLRLMGAERLQCETLRLPLAARWDERSVAHTLAVEMRPGAEAKSGFGRALEADPLLFSVTRLPGGNLEGADTTQWGCARLALINWWREYGV